MAKLSWQTQDLPKGVPSSACGSSTNNGPPDGVITMDQLRRNRNPFDTDLLSRERLSSDDDGALNTPTGNSGSLVDLDRWQRFAVWQLQRYRQRHEDPGVARRWAQMNHLDLETGRPLPQKESRDSDPSRSKLSRAHVQKQPDANLPDPRFQNDPAATVEKAEPLPIATTTSSARKRTRAVAKEMPVMLLQDQTDLFSVPPARPLRTGDRDEAPSRKPPLAFSTSSTAKFSRSSSGKLFQPHESSSEEERSEDLGSRARRRRRIEPSDSSQGHTEPSRISGTTGFSATTTANTSLRSALSTSAPTRVKPKRIKAMTLPTGRSLVLCSRHLCYRLLLGAVRTDTSSFCRAVHKVPRCL